MRRRAAWARCSLAEPASPARIPACRCPSGARRVVVTSAIRSRALHRLSLPPNPFRSTPASASPARSTASAFTAISDEWLLDKQAAVLTGSGFADRPRHAAGRARRAHRGGRRSPRRLRAVAASVESSRRSRPRRGPPTPRAMAASSYAAYRAREWRAYTAARRRRHAHASTSTAPAPAQAVQARLPAHRHGEGARQRRDAHRRDRARRLRHRALHRRRHHRCLRALGSRPSTPPRPTPLADSFDAGQRSNPQLWQVTDPGVAHRRSAPAGSTLTGGNGFDGQTTLAASDQIEIGGIAGARGGERPAGRAVATASSAASTPEPSSGANCFAGWNVRQSGGNTVLTPLLNGAETGSKLHIAAGAHLYAAHSVTCCRDPARPPDLLRPRRRRGRGLRRWRHRLRAHRLSSS